MRNQWKSRNVQQGPVISKHKRLPSKKTHASPENNKQQQEDDIFARAFSNRTLEIRIMFNKFRHLAEIGYGRKTKFSGMMNDQLRDGFTFSTFSVSHFPCPQTFEPAHVDQ